MSALVPYIPIVSSLLLVLVSIRLILLSRTVHRLQEENFDLKFQLEVMQARGIAVHPFTGGHS